MGNNNNAKTRTNRTCKNDYGHRAKLTNYMLYYLFNYLKTELNISGSGMFQYITFRVTMALLLSLAISLLLGKTIVSYLRNAKQIGENHPRARACQGENTKKGTPTMGGLIILSAIVILYPPFATRTERA